VAQVFKDQMPFRSANQQYQIKGNL